MFCRYCGKQIQKDVSFCPYCGGSLATRKEDTQKEPSRKHQNPQRKRKRSIVKGLIGLLLLISLVIGSGMLLAYFNIVEIPVISSLLDKTTISQVPADDECISASENMDDAADTEEEYSASMNMDDVTNAAEEIVPTTEYTIEAAEGGEIAIFWYTFGDPNLNKIRAAMNEMLNASGTKYRDYDGNTSQATQIEQIQTAITAGADALIVNLADASSTDATQAIVSMAKNANLPLVFFNRPVSEEVVSTYDKAAYIGTDYTHAGHLQGKMIGEYVLANYDTIDLNGDGEISYVMFKGQEGNMEADARTKYGVEDADAILTSAGKPALKFYDKSNPSKYLVDRTGSWSAAEGQKYMQTILAQYSEANSNMVELVIANTDAMAIGAIEALQTAGYNKNDGGKIIPVFGIDATADAQRFIANKYMTGTVKRDAIGMANAIVIIAQNMVAGKDKFDSIDVANIINTCHVDIPYVIYTFE